MQPVQLSLMPDQLPAPPEALIERVPHPQVEKAMVLLADLIAKAAQTSTAVTACEAAGAGAGDE